MLIQVLASASVALDGRHTPALYSRFLSSQMARYQTILENDTSRLLPYTDNDSTLEPSLDQQSLASSGVAVWPDINHTQHYLGHDSRTALPKVDQQSYGEGEMDFSMQYFMAAVNSQDSNHLLNEAIESGDLYSLGSPSEYL